VQLVESLHVVPLLLALAGAYAVLRAPGARRIGYVWLAVLAVFVAARGWLGFVRSNPDALGYLMPAFAAVGALAAAFVAAVLATVGGADRERPRRTTVVVAVGLAVLGLAQIQGSAERASLARFDDTDTIAEVSRRHLPTGAVILAHDPQTVFHQWGTRAGERLRPDVTLVPVPFLSYPGMMDSLVERDPALTELLRAWALDGELTTASLQTLASRRPVFVEMDSRVPGPMWETIVPNGFFHRVLPDAAYDDDRHEGVLDQEKTWRRLDRLLGAPGERMDPGTENRLLWHYYVSALYLAATGERGAAREAVRRGLAINPEAEELRGLRGALASEDGDGPVDVEPFMPRRLR